MKSEVQLQIVFPDERSKGVIVLSTPTIKRSWKDRLPWVKSVPSPDQPNADTDPADNVDEAMPAVSVKKQPKVKAAKPINLEAVAKKKKRQRRYAVTALVFNPVLRGLLIGVLGGATIALLPTFRYWQLQNEFSSLQTADKATQASMQSQLDAYRAQCTDPNACKTFDFVSAEQAAALYATDCFSYYADRPASEQAARLTADNGPSDCGWKQQGTGTAQVFIDSTQRQTIPDASGKASTSMGIVGVKVKVAGQPAPLSYIVVVKSVGNVFSVVTPGALYSAPPTPGTLIQGCTPDATTTSATEIPKLTERLNALEEGRVQNSSVILSDQLPDGSGLTMSQFGPSITDIKVESIALCRGNDPNNVTFVSRELLSGPTPNAIFEFQLGWTASRTDASTSWRISGWGPILDTNLGPF